mmetsp:Transcript_28882/g.96093  ORF Transcript_28882/g.96093 Transcript_28882/m.96093 type:complete len:565 (+) Transcript_28882:105-1799(+)
MAPPRHTARVALALGVAVALVVVERVSGQSCNPSDPGYLQEWCFERCLAMQGWLRLRFSYDFFDVSHWDQSEALSLWEVCPQAHISLRYAQAVLEFRQRPRLEETRARALRNEFEHETRLNNKMWRRCHVPQCSSSAKLFRQSQTHSKVLPPADASCQEGPSTGFSAGDYARALREYVEREEVPPRTSLPSDPAAATIDAVGGRCSTLAAALVFAAADMQRQQLDNPKRWQRASQLILKASDIMRCAIRQHEPSGYLADVAAGCVPIFELIDRLDRQIVVPLQLEESPLWKDRTFKMHVLPTNNLESNHVRGLLKLHCDGAFQRFARERFDASASAAKTAGSSRPFSFVEVGAHLGGCTLFAATHLAADVQALAVEPFAPAASALQRSASANGLAGRLRVAARIICEGGGGFEHRRKVADEAPWQHQPAWVELPSEADAASSTDPAADGGGALRQRCSRLDAVLGEHGVGAVDLLRVHVLGAELSVLRSALPMLQSGAVKAVAVAVFSKGMDWARQQDPSAIGRLLRSSGFSISYEGREGDAAETALETQLAMGTSTLLAWLPS